MCEIHLTKLPYNAYMAQQVGNVHFYGLSIACDECAIGEIWSLQHMWVTDCVMWAAASGDPLKFGVQGVSVTDFHELMGCDITGVNCTMSLLTQQLNSDWMFSVHSQKFARTNLNDILIDIYIYNHEIT